MIKSLPTLFAVAVFSLTLTTAFLAETDRPFWRTVVMGTHGMVAAEHPLEAMAALKILQDGGNAIDAAVAAFYVTTVVEHHQAGIGGDGFILAYLAPISKRLFSLTVLAQHLNWPHVRHTLSSAVFRVPDHTQLMYLVL